MRTRLPAARRKAFRLSPLAASIARTCTPAFAIPRQVDFPIENTSCGETPSCTP